MRVRGGCAILWRQQGVSQIGTSPGRRTIVSDLSLAEQRLLDEFARSLESTGVYRAARRSRVPVALFVNSYIRWYWIFRTLRRMELLLKNFSVKILKQWLMN